MPPATIPTTEPVRLVAGDTWRWDRTEPSYAPANGWTLKYAVRGPSILNITASANTAGTGWEITVAATDTAKLTPGAYRWSKWVEKAGERYTLVQDVPLTVDPDLLQDKPGDRLAWCVTTLAIVEKVIAGRVDDDLLEHQVDNRAVKHHSLRELRELRASLKQEVAQLNRRSRRLAPFAVAFTDG